MLRMKDLADRLGLSQTTISHVLSGRHQEFRISPDTVERVKRTAEALGYRANALARAFRDRRSYSVGLVVEDLTNPFWTGIAVGAEREAEKHGYMLVVSNTAGSVERERQALSLLHDGRVDGLLIPPFARTETDLSALARDGLPFVQIDRALPRIKAPCVRTDHEAGSRMAVDHLVKRGHRRVALLTGPQDIQPFELRTKGFRAAAKKHGLEQAKVVTVKNAVEEQGRTAVAELIRGGLSVSALYTANVWLTFGALRAVREAGLQVPRDLEIVGFDDVPQAGLLRDPVSTVVHDVEGIGQQAFALLMQLRGGKKLTRETIIQPRLVAR
jgi:LacI family transcriptional regulator